MVCLRELNPREAEAVGSLELSDCLRWGSGSATEPISKYKAEEYWESTHVDAEWNWQRLILSVRAKKRGVSELRWLSHVFQTRRAVAMVCGHMQSHPYTYTWLPRHVFKLEGHIVRNHLEEADFTPEKAETLHKGHDLPGYNLIQ